MAEFSKTAQYAGLTDLPPLVVRAVALAHEQGFIACCFPEQGRLLQVLARGRAGGVIVKAGTGCGAGLAWMASAVGPDTRLVSVERDAGRAAACQALFAGLANVTVLHGDWRLIERYAPFDLLVLDGGGGAKRGGEAVAPPDSDGRSVTAARRHWLEHPALFATEVRVHPQVSTIGGTLRAARP
jgi:hypothetical protein